MRTVMIIVLNYSGRMLPEVDAALARTADMIRERGWGLIIKRRVGDSILPRARNNSLAEFLYSQATDLICLDDDVSWDADEMMRLLDAPADFVAGIYPAKAEGSIYYVRYMPKHELWSDENGLIEVEGVPAGFVRLSRACVERLSMSYAHLQYDDDTTPHGHAWCLFNFELKHNRLWGEDYIFCDRWRDIGGRIFIDPGITLHHHGKPDPDTGECKTYTGCIGDWLRSRPLKEVA